MDIFVSFSCQWKVVAHSNVLVATCNVAGTVHIIDLLFVDVDINYYYANYWNVLVEYVVEDWTGKNVLFGLE